MWVTNWSIKGRIEMNVHQIVRRHVEHGGHDRGGQLEQLQGQLGALTELVAALVDRLPEHEQRKFVNDYTGYEVVKDRP